jgi:hypothetical protein
VVASGRTSNITPVDELLVAGEPRELGVDNSRIRFIWGSASRRAQFLVLDDSALIETTGWCGTCAFWFHELLQDPWDGGTSLKELERVLAEGIDDLDERVIQAYGSLFPRGMYRPLLLRIRPRLIKSFRGRHAEREKWRTKWGTNTPVYRASEGSIDSETRFYEVVVPLVPPGWNERRRVHDFIERLAASSKPTAVALSILTTHDIGNMGDPNWMLTHFLLDGHHKMRAASVSRRPLQLLSLLSSDASMLHMDDGPGDPLDRLTKALAGSQT